jgi:hypothetical protein
MQIERDSLLGIEPIRAISHIELMVPVRRCEGLARVVNAHMRRLVGGIVSDLPRGLPRKRHLSMRAAAFGVRCIPLVQERRYALFGIVLASHNGAGLRHWGQSYCRRERLPQERGPMISNVLSEAIEQIKRYRLEFDTFPTDWPEMDDLVSRMDQMRVKLQSGNKIDEPEDYVRPGTNEIP